VVGWGKGHIGALDAYQRRVGVSNSWEPSHGRCGGGVNAAKHRAGQRGPTEVACTPLDDDCDDDGWLAFTLETGSSRPRLEPLLNWGPPSGSCRSNLRPCCHSRSYLRLCSPLPSLVDKGTSPLQSHLEPIHDTLHTAIMSGLTQKLHTPHSGDYDQPTGL
jgi:hypothetical protein